MDIKKTLDERPEKIYPSVEETRDILKNNPTFISTLIAIALVNDIKLEPAIALITCLFHNGLVDMGALYHFVKRIKNK